MKLPWNGVFILLLSVSLILFAAPFILFAAERSIGVLAGHQEWIAQGLDHGPWHGKWEGFTLFVPVMGWAPITVITALFYAITIARWRPIISGLGLVGLQAAALIIQLQTLVWLIE